MPPRHQRRVAARPSKVAPGVPASSPQSQTAKPLRVQRVSPPDRTQVATCACMLPITAALALRAKLALTRNSKLLAGALGTMEPPGLQLALLRQLLRGLRQQGPSPASRTPPGYLRAFTAEAATQVAAEGGAAAAAAASSTAATAAAEAAPAAAAAIEAAQAAAKTGKRPPHMPSTLSAFLGLTNVLEQQQAQMAGQPAAERLSPALRAMTWHQRYMDDTPAGRELRRNWQRQVRAVEGCPRAVCSACPRSSLRRSRIRQEEGRGMLAVAVQPSLPGNHGRWGAPSLVSTAPSRRPVHLKPAMHELLQTVQPVARCPPAPMPICPTAHALARRSSWRPRRWTRLGRGTRRSSCRRLRAARRRRCPRPDRCCCAGLGPSLRPYRRSSSG